MTLVQFIMHGGSSAWGTYQKVEFLWLSSGYIEPDKRPMAIGGRFYPANGNARGAAANRCIGQITSTQQQHRSRQATPPIWWRNLLHRRFADFCACLAGFFFGSLR